MKLPSKEQIAAFREGCYSHKKPEGNRLNHTVYIKTFKLFFSSKFCIQIVTCWPDIFDSTNIFTKRSNCIGSIVMSISTPSLVLNMEQSLSRASKTKT